ncbi:MAG: preprotein translocase subunit YajC [Proteobacteria bacterium]|nr:preprotein translocase subunit YajC [Pseudomonadota bacterium]
MGQAGGGGAPKGGDMQFIIMMIVIFAIFYFLLIRPQKKKQQDLRKMIESLKHGDMVITTGGVHGKITGLTENVVTIEIADKVKIKVSRGHIGAVIQKAEETE